MKRISSPALAAMACLLVLSAGCASTPRPVPPAPLVQHDDPLPPSVKPLTVEQDEQLSR